MRCTACHSYIPEGLPVPVICPQCGRSADGNIQSTVPTSPVQTPTSAAEPSSVKEPIAPATNSWAITNSPLSEPNHDATTEAFAPYFSIVTTLAFGPASTQLSLRHPTPGSLSFGPQGIGIVFDNGRHWEKLYYRDITAIYRQGDSILITSGATESRLTLYHPWLPTWYSPALQSRANVFIELFARVKNGLNSYEVSLFQRRLR